MASITIGSRWVIKKESIFIIIRILSLTFFKNYFLRELFKKFVVKILITKKNKLNLINERTIDLSKNIKIHDKVTSSKSIII